MTWILTVPILSIMYPITEELLDLFRVPELVSDLTEDRGGKSFYQGQKR
jgi:hypothetical protein